MNGAVRERLRTAWRLFREFSGERAYEIYVEHQRERHPGEPVLSEREFWRRHADGRDAEPRVVCC